MNLSGQGTSDGSPRDEHLLPEGPATGDAASKDQDETACWICLSSELPLSRPCGCPNYVHRSCLARWQLRSAGKSEETCCRFCAKRFPDWRLSLSDRPKAPPLMTVTHDCQVHVLQVEPGAAGRLKFEEQIRSIFGLAPDDQVTVTFGIKEPFSGDDCTLEGWGAWTAAVECAAYSAASRRAASEAAAEARSQAPPAVREEGAEASQEQQRRSSRSKSLISCLQSFVNWYQG